MVARPFHLLILLAVGVSMTAIRPVGAVPHGHGSDDRHVHDDHAGHHHEHDHGLLKHAHPHHHHSNEPHEQGTDHHDSDVDGRPDIPKARWAAPRRIEISAPPSPPLQMALMAPTASGWLPSRRAKPPPAPIQASHLIPLRTIILRL